jgi:hypothetical protein
MKKICLTLVAASAMLFSAQTLSAQEAVETEVSVEATVTQESEYTQVEITDLPAEVQQALERDHEGAVITEAYAKDVEGAKEYKLVVKTAQGEEKHLFADAEGNWIDPDQE